MNKTVDCIKNMFNNNTTKSISGKGTLTEDGKFVVGATVRVSNFDSKNPTLWKLTTKQTAMIAVVARIDISIALWDEEKNEQGAWVIPYLSARQMAMKDIQTQAISEFVAYHEDNTGNAQYKNFLLSNDLHNTIELEVSRASLEAVERIKNGEVNYGSSMGAAVSLIDAAARIAEVRPPKPRTQIQQQNIQAQNIANNAIPSELDDIM